MSDKRLGWGRGQERLRRGRKPETKFNSRVRIFYPIPFTFILQVCELAYLYVAKVHMGVMVEWEYQNYLEGPR